MSMLNLMPPEAKEDIAYGRRNGKLLTWCFLLLAVVAGMGVMVVFGGMYIDRSKTSLQSSIASTNTTIQTEKLDDVQKDYQDLSDGVKLIVQILQKEIRYSKLLQQIGSVIPAKTALTSIVLSNKIDNALDLQARASSYDTATQIQINLQDPKNKLFEKVDTNSITCNAVTKLQPGQPVTPDYILTSNYPCTVSLRALFKKDASFLFINSPTSATKTTTGAKP